MKKKKMKYKKIIVSHYYTQSNYVYFETSSFNFRTIFNITKNNEGVYLGERTVLVRCGVLREGYTEKDLVKGKIDSILVKYHDQPVKGGA